MTADSSRYVPGDDAAAAALAVDGCRALAAAGQSDMVWGHPGVRDPAGRTVWGQEEDTIAKRADVWSPAQLRAGYEYLLRQAAPPSGTAGSAKAGPGAGRGVSPWPNAPDIRPMGL
jgi:hypothetical protein